MDLIDGLKAFVATAQTGSFTRAAERLGISNRLTSKYVAELETRIDTRLLQRTTRQVSLTPAGQDLLARAPALLDELEDMLGSVAEDAKGLSGLLRISAPVTYGETHLRRLLSRFSSRHPNIIIDLRLNDAHVDLATEGFDLAFRIGQLESASLKYRQLGQVRNLLVASPDYLQRYPTPQNPADLQHHRCIVDTNTRGDPRWSFQQNGAEFTFAPSRQLMVNSARVARDWALDGIGVALCPDFVLQQSLADGSLVPLLEEFQTRQRPICAVYLSGSVLSRKVRALIDFAVEEFE
ncbi:LysR family transcriptional regulator [Motiliproteus coralliicola]|uniref:LysR family transcriptional regulator n=1 Tax=Motiliproteus coralliicola TaxID=2283196 RepID=A0A369WCV4_9GAMM|nr:LysR family transcriptional regulator [Motiliproteus coralliicola]RDE19009.1 LysR family transcriptional regulator [Motiliproteus coralliicola]